MVALHPPMYLKQLSLINFKNYAEATVLFHPKLNCFTGRNGMGKTNLLDAIYYLSFAKVILTKWTARILL